MAEPLASRARAMNCFRLCDACELELAQLMDVRGNDVPLVSWCWHQDHGVHALQFRGKRTLQPCQTLEQAEFINREYAAALSQVAAFAAAVAASSPQRDTRIN
jgi:hypothetical protein